MSGAYNDAVLERLFAGTRLADPTSPDVILDNDLARALRTVVRQGALITRRLDVDPGVNALPNYEVRELVGRRDGLCSALVILTGRRVVGSYSWIDLMRTYESLTRDAEWA